MIKDLSEVTVERKRKNIEGNLKKMAMFNFLRGKQERYLDLAREDDSPRTKREIEIKAGKQIDELKKQQRLQQLEKTGKTFGKSFNLLRRPPQQDFTFHEQVLRETFGHGEHIWGTNMQPVEMNHDLNPRQRGDFSTAELFGF